ncbi:MAG: hypothetical protein WBN27_11955, partial [Eudoraea sp.]|uniref:hypothetical protein n=1 Tax=Eudoraea sp. TaxID=1979955 RepID=UPI003C76856B
MRIQLNISQNFCDHPAASGVRLPACPAKGGNKPHPEYITILLFHLYLIKSLLELLRPSRLRRDTLTSLSRQRREQA